MSAAGAVIRVAGPWYEDLSVGEIFESAPAVTVTEGLASAHQAILGDRLRLALDAHLSESVAGQGPALAHPGLVCDLAIGQSTLVTHRVVANLFYRGLRLRRLPRLGDTLTTVTEVVALRDTSQREGRPPTGLAVLRIRTTDQHDRLVLDFYRCAMLPMSSEAARPGHVDDLASFTGEFSAADLVSAIDDLNLARYKQLVPGRHGGELSLESEYVVETGDTVTGATELVRLSLNIAAVHSDPAATANGRRLVYGGHTIGIACSHLTRALPNLATIVAWRSCDHLAPVFEGDVLYSTVKIESLTPVAAGEGVFVGLRVQTSSATAAGERTAVLDWRLVGVMAT